MDSEYCAENEKIEKETFSYAADEKDRIVVLWDVVQITYTLGEEGIDLPGVELEHSYVNSEANYEAKDEYAEDNNLSTIQGSITINGTTGWNWPSTVRNLKVRNTTYTATKI